jgi:cytochrome c6
MKCSTKEGWKATRKKECKEMLDFAVLLAALFVSPMLFAETHPGEDVFKAKCASCHGADGAGKTTMGSMLKIRDLGSPEVQKQSDAELNRIITKGKNKMPAFEGKLKKEQIEQLVGYIRELGKKR